MRRLRWAISLTAIAFFLLSEVSLADAIDEPLQLSNRQPLAQLFNLPAMRSGEVLAADVSAWRIGVDVANNFVREQQGDERLVLDGESQRYELGWRRGFGDGVELGVTVPWISYNGGVLDGFIEDWHRLWGLPDGDRPDYARHQVLFRYERNGRSELDFRRAESGLGDIQLNAAWQLLKSTHSAVALSTQLNLPTGDADRLTGSGKGSAAFLIAANREHLFDGTFGVSGNIGGQWQPRGDVLGDTQNRAVWFAAGEVNWAVAQDWRLKAQLQIHSALYDSDLRALGDESMQLLLGGTVRLSQRWLLDVAVGEDVAVDTAPDVTLQLALKANF